MTRTQNNPVLVPQGSNGTAGGRQGQQGQQGAAGAAATLENVTAREIPRSAITLLQQIGEGQFGEVSLVWLSYPWDSKCRKIEGNLNQRSYFLD